MKITSFTLSVLLMAGFFCATLVVPNQAEAQADTVNAKLLLAALALKAKYGPDLEVMYTDMDSLSRGDAKQYSGTFYRNTAYVQLGVGESESQDIDMYVYGEEGNIIGQHNSTSDICVVKHTQGRLSENFDTQLKMHKGRGLFGYMIMHQ